jgi:hypothetical protein
MDQLPGSPPARDCRAAVAASRRGTTGVMTYDIFRTID